MRLRMGLVALCLSAGLAAGEGPGVQPIVEVKVTPKTSVFKGSVWNKPLVIKSQDEAAKHFDKEALEAIAKKVDFKNQMVLLFAWRGSGGDKLEHMILESFPEQIPFSLRRGLTRDLRTHSRVFALRSDVRWSVKATR